MSDAIWLPHMRSRSDGKPLYFLTAGCLAKSKAGNFHIQPYHFCSCHLKKMIILLYWYQVSVLYCSVYIIISRLWHTVSTWWRASKLHANWDENIQEKDTLYCPGRSPAQPRQYFKYNTHFAKVGIGKWTDRPLLPLGQVCLPKMWSLNTTQKGRRLFECIDTVPWESP